MGFMDFTEKDAFSDKKAEVADHVKWLLDNNELTEEAGEAQFMYLLGVSDIDKTLIIGGLMGIIARGDHL